MRELPVNYIAPGTFRRCANYDQLVTVVTDTGRTYMIQDDQYSCMIKNGEYMSHANHFLLWLIDLEKPKS